MKKCMKCLCKEHILILLVAFSAGLFCPFVSKAQCPPSPNCHDCGNISPGVTIAGSTTICANDPVAGRTITFNYTTAIIVDQVCVDFGDGQTTTIYPTSTSITATHTYTDIEPDYCHHNMFQPPVIYLVDASFYITCPNGCSFDRTSTQVTLIDAPRPKIGNMVIQCMDATSCVTVGACSGTTSTGSLCSCTNTYTQSPGSYTWYFGDSDSAAYIGVTSNLYSSECHQYAHGGTYTVTLTATNICGTRTDILTNVQVVKIDTLELQSTATGNYCSNDIVRLNLSGSGPGGNTFQTSVTAGPQLPVIVNDANTDHPYVIFPEGGQYQIHVNYGVCSGDIPINITQGVEMTVDSIPDSCFYSSYNIDLSQYFISNNPNQTNTAVVTKNSSQIYSGGLGMVTLMDTGTYHVAVTCSTLCNTHTYTQDFILNVPYNFTLPHDTTVCLQSCVALPMVNGIAPTYNGTPAPDPFCVNTPGSYQIIYTPSCGNSQTYTINTQGVVATFNDFDTCAYRGMIPLAGSYPGMSFSDTPNTFVTNNTFDGNASTHNTIYTEALYSSYTDAATGCTYRDTGTITVAPSFNASAAFPGITCANVPVTAVVSGSYTTYTIAWGDATITVDDPNHIYNSSDTFVIAVTFSDANCDTTIYDSIVVIPAPNAVFTLAPDTLCVDNTAAITYNNDPLYSYSWTYNDTVTPSPPTIVAANNSNQIVCYPVELTVSYANCPTATGTQDICFYPDTKALIALNYDDECSPLPVTIFNNSIIGGGSATYEWYRNDTLFSRSDTLIQNDTLYAGQTDSTYEYMLVVTSCGKTDSVKQSVTVHTTDFNPAIYTSDFTPCRFAEVTLTSSVIPGCTVTYDFGDSTYASANSEDAVTHAYSSAGAYTVRMTMYCACQSKSDSLSLDVQPGPDITVSAPTDTCSNSPVAISSQITGTVAVSSYTTYFGDATPIVTSPDPNPTHYYSTGGIDTGWMVAHGVNGCNSDTADFVVNIHEPPRITALVGDTNACTGVLTVIVSDSFPNTTYEWAIAYNGIETTTVTTYNGELPFYADNVGSYRIVLNAYNNNYPSCIYTSGNFDITVYPSPTAFFTVEAPYVKNSEYVFNLHNMSSPVGNTYIWDFSDGSLSYEVNPAAHAYTDMGSHNIVLYARNGPCEDTAVRTIMVDPYLQIFLPNTFTPNSDGTNDFFQVFGNTQDLDFLHVKIFNRIGEKVFDSYDNNFRWDGVYKGKPLAPAVFVYIMEVSARNDDDVRFMEGSITLVR